MQDREGVKRLCRVLAMLALAGMAAVPLVTLTVWWFPQLLSDEVYATLGGSNVDPAALLALGPLQRITGMLVLLTGSGLQMAALWFLRRTFLEGAEGRWFSLAAVRNFRRFAWLSLVIVAVSVVQDSALSVITTIHLPPGQQMLVLSFGSNDFQRLFTGLVMLFVAHIFAAGREVDEENASFI